MASEDGHTECVRLLVEGGANMDAKDEVRDTCLYFVSIVCTSVYPCVEDRLIFYAWRFYFQKIRRVLPVYSCIPCLHV